MAKRAIKTPEKLKQADTSSYLLLRILFGDAQRYSMAYGVAIKEGLGKSYCAEDYCKLQDKAFYIKCNESDNRRTVLKKISAAMGIGEDKANISLAITTLVTQLEQHEEPLLIFDDAHLLKGRLLHFVILIYKRLINHCGIILMGNDDLKEKVIGGARLAKPEYEEIFNTVGRRFVTLGQCGPRDVELICKANGIDDARKIDAIKEESKGNLHKVTELIHSLPKF